MNGAVCNDAVNSYSCVCGTGYEGTYCETATSLTIQLSGGTSGRLLVYFAGAWGTVCDDSFDLNAGNVVCKQLGLTGYSTHATVGGGTGSIVLDNLVCTGSETNIAQCTHNGYLSHNCGHSEDLGVTCKTTQVRIASSTNSGRVEIFYNGAWGTVCDDSFDATDAGVICRMLGYSSGSAICCGGAGAGTGSILVDNLACTGSETDILLCPHAGLLVHNCGHGEDAGITCS
eukprot:XP_011678891.1 PREDICTED: deleted in malignant brain tumors 1 protein-like [Strongylocentrotus purpuratus]